MQGKEQFGNLDWGTQTIGESLLEVTKQQQLLIANTLFKQKLTGTATCLLPGSLHHSQIEFISVNKKFSITNK